MMSPQRRRTEAPSRRAFALSSSTTPIPTSSPTRVVSTSARLASSSAVPTPTTSPTSARSSTEPATTARDSMRDALVTLTRFSTELSHALDDERRSGDRRRYAPDISRLPRGTRLPVFAKQTSAESRIERPHSAPSYKPVRVSLSKRPSPTPSASATPPASATAMQHIAPDILLAQQHMQPDRPRSNGPSSAAEGRRRRREAYRNDLLRATQAAAAEVCVVTGRPVVAQFDIDDNVITDDDLAFEVPKLCPPEVEQAAATARGNVLKEDHQHNVHEGGCSGAGTVTTTGPTVKWKPRARETALDDTALDALRAQREREERAHVVSGFAAAGPGAPLPCTPAKGNALVMKPVCSTSGTSSTNRKKKSVRLNLGATELSEWNDSMALQESVQDIDSFVASNKTSSHFIPTADARFVKQQSYCKTGHVPGFRRTRFLRLIGSELQCYSRDLNKQLWITDVQHSFIKISNSQRRVVIFCVAAKKAITFYLASADMCASWARALARASVKTYPRKMTSQKTAKELAREGIFFHPV